ncbi:MAG: YHS domain-containing (seleno)protein [Phycisphaerales bacterium]
MSWLSQSAHAENVEPTATPRPRRLQPRVLLRRVGAKPGSPVCHATYEGVTYFFANSDELKKFNKNPEKYAPVYGGWCAYGMAVEGKFGADPTNYKIVNGKLNVFLRATSSIRWSFGTRATRSSCTQGRRVLGHTE